MSALQTHGERCTWKSKNCDFTKRNTSDDFPEPISAQVFQAQTQPREMVSIVQKSATTPSTEAEPCRKLKCASGTNAQNAMRRNREPHLQEAQA